MQNYDWVFFHVGRSHGMEAIRQGAGARPGGRHKAARGGPHARPAKYVTSPNVSGGRHTTVNKIGSQYFSNWIHVVCQGGRLAPNMPAETVHLHQDDARSIQLEGRSPTFLISCLYDIGRILSTVWGYLRLKVGPSRFSSVVL